MLTRPTNNDYRDVLAARPPWYKTPKRGSNPTGSPVMFSMQATLESLGFCPGPLDGLWGSKTRAALVAWRKASTCAFGAPLEAHAEDFYGPVGTSQVMILPYPMRLAWKLDVLVTRMQCHKLVAKPMANIFQGTLDHYGISHLTDLGLDKFGGCLNVRKKRGGSTMSMHSYGIAVDMDPLNNRLRWDHTRAKLALIDYIPFWDIVEEAGAYSLGRTQDRDWMHFQFAKP